MSTFEVILTETIRHQVVLDASNADEAIDLAMDVIGGEQLTNIYQVESSSTEIEVEEVNHATLEYDG
jgi:hypothetical protein